MLAYSCLHVCRCGLGGGVSCSERRSRWGLEAKWRHVEDQVASGWEVSRFPFLQTLRGLPGMRGVVAGLKSSIGESACERAYMILVCAPLPLAGIICIFSNHFK